MAFLNLGILAHVDAGKTSLTERILFETGVIPALGSVDKGTTQTDTLDLERARGITIKAAVASFVRDGLTVNLIDTPGHADFVAEVTRSLAVLDGVVLVVSAVEGVQSQTRRLARAVRAAGLPLLLFVNKIDRLGARGEQPLLAEIRRRLELRPVALNAPVGLGDREATVVPGDWADPAWRGRVADVLAEANEAVIAAFDRGGGDLDAAFVRAELQRQVAAGGVVPVLFGSAITGVGVPELLDGIAAWLPQAAGNADAPLAATVFKVARRPSGEKVAYARLFAGELAVRQRVPIHRRDASGGEATGEERVTGIDRLTAGAGGWADAAGPGEIVALHGLRSARIGDRLGGAGGDLRDVDGSFPAPALESVAEPLDPAQELRLRAALEELAEQDPLISLRQRNAAGELSVRLYGEVQKEVLTETLAREYGVAVAFGPSRTVCVERPLGSGEHAEIMGAPGNPFRATIGLRVLPAEPGAGVRYERELGALPLAFYRAIEETVVASLAQGLCGWEVTDCVVALTAAGFCSVTSTAGDFRKLAPLALTDALRAAGTVVCEPIEELDLAIPAAAFGAVCGLLTGARATIRSATLDGPTQRIVCAVPTAELREVERRLPGLTGNEADWLSAFAGYVPVAGEPPVRPRVGPDPRQRAWYLAEVARG